MEVALATATVAARETAPRSVPEGSGIADAPLWDMTPIFPALDSPEVPAALESVRASLRDLAALFDRHHVRAPNDPTTRRPDDPIAFDGVTNAYNALLQEMRVLRNYLACLVSTDAANEHAQALLSQVQREGVTLAQLAARYTAWVGALDLDRLLAQSEVAKAHEFPLRKLQRYARHQLSEAEESLAAELVPTALAGWKKLHSDVSALLEVTVSVKGEERVLPMSAVRALANDRDRETRRAAFEVELAAWKRVEVPLAASLNGIKGSQSVLHRRRGFADDIAPTLLANNIDRETLEAMQTACVESFPDFRRYMAAKARALGLPKLAWYDLQAPVAADESRYTWPEAERFVAEQFGRYSNRLRDFAERTYREQWIDAPPYPRKEGGAYCMPIRPGESRILMNFDGSFNSVSTLAHELGHAYHGLNLAARTSLQRETPSALAETASIFCEQIAFDAALQEATGQTRLALLDTSLERDLMVVVDIHSRFLFEKAVFEKRAQRELSPREFCELMTAAQRQTYGDGLDLETLHPYMWAVKGHYYGPVFYNYPYTFGLLFGLGLYARRAADPEGFTAAYDDLLASTGLADAATLAARFGIDTRTPAFWRTSLDLIRAHIAEFERLVGA